MGLSDIFYEEFNRFRDKLGSEEDRKKITKEALKKSLTKFKFLWEDQIMGNAYNGEMLHRLFREISGDFLNLAVEVDTILKDDKITTNLREMSKQFIQMANSPRTLDFMEVITSEINQSWDRIEQITKQLD